MRLTGSHRSQIRNGALTRLRKRIRTWKNLDKEGKEGRYPRGGDVIFGSDSRNTNTVRWISTGKKKGETTI
jgi:hypothetical protein